MERTKSAVIVFLLPAVLALALMTVGPTRVDLDRALANPQRYVDELGADRLAVLVIGMLLWAATMWLSAAALAALATAIPGAVGRLASAVADLITPQLLRNAAALAIGLGVATSSSVYAAGSQSAAATPTHSSAAATGGTGAVAATVPPEASNDPDIDWPSSTEESTATTEPSTVTVHVGDCLWDLAAKYLDPAASMSEVATAVVAWWRTNQAVIGDDPNLLYPGQELVVPQG